MFAIEIQCSEAFAFTPVAWASVPDRSHAEVSVILLIVYLETLQTAINRYHYQGDGMDKNSYFTIILRHLFTLSFCCLLVACDDEGQSKQASLQAMTEKSTIVFEGTISMLGGTTVSALPASLISTY